MGKTEKREMIHGVEREEKVKGTDQQIKKQRQ